MCKQRLQHGWKNRCKECGGKGWVKVYPHSDEIASVGLAPSAREVAQNCPLTNS